MKAATFLKRLQRTPAYEGRIVHVERLLPRDACYGNPREPLDPRLQGLLEAKGYWPLYSHQAQAIDLLRQGDNVMVSTPGASGKSLCYHLAMLDALLKERRSCSLYIYPTKALAQDQLKGLRELAQGLIVNAAIFDGDTPTEERPPIRRWTQVLLTNPDMLHLGILPNRRAWSRFFRDLRFVVLDEAHVYRGVFGSHVANVLRRLRRLCWLYGSKAQFILCSATIANPGELAQGLTGLPVRVIDGDGAPYGGKRFVFWNSPLTGGARSSRRSTNTEVSNLLAELVRQRIRTLTFVKTRKLAELIYLYTRNQLAQGHPNLMDRLASYRASYLPDERRSIEQALFRGDLLGVATTSALELGIDVGDLDATLIAGYPGTISSTWQQAGRSGRRGEESLTILIAQDNPLDQYLMRHPQAFFGRSTEKALISPQNPHIIGPHLLCAAYEAPIGLQDKEVFGENLSDHLRFLEAQGLLHQRDGKWYLTPSLSYPAQEVNLRSASKERYLVVEQPSGAILETVEEASVFSQLHSGAVYLHRGETYLIGNLDQGSHLAHASRQDLPYYTEAKDVTDIRILRTWEAKTAGGVNVYLGEVEVSNRVVGYRKKAPFTEEVLGDEYLDLPPRLFNTVALWFDVPPRVLARCALENGDFVGGLHAVEHAAIGVLPLFAMCDRNDIGGVSTPFHPDTGRPQVFIYDGHPGGIGIAERGYHVIGELWRTTFSAVSECSCDGGCPSCIQSPKCGNNNQPLDKAVAVGILRELLEERHDSDE